MHLDHWSSEMHKIAQICTSIFNNFLGVTPLDPITGEGTSPLPRLLPLGARPPSHFFRASADAAKTSGLCWTQFILVKIFSFNSNYCYL